MKGLLRTIQRLLSDRISFTFLRGDVPIVQSWEGSVTPLSILLSSIDALGEIFLAYN
jgi:hypothetical protein